MRIDDYNPVDTTATRSNKTAETTEAARASHSRNHPAHGLASDRVELSDIASQLSRILHADASDRANLIGRLAAQVQSGKYIANPVEVGRALITETLALGEKP